MLRLQTEPGTGAQTCIVCDQCAKACPDDLIALGGHREPGQKIKVLDYFDFNLSRCSFCGLCAEVCPTKPIKALIMSEDYELGQLQPGNADPARRPDVRRRPHRAVHALTFRQHGRSELSEWFMHRRHSAGICAVWRSSPVRLSRSTFADAGRRSRRLRKSGFSSVQFLSEGRYADALDAYQQALRLAHRRHATSGPRVHGVMQAALRVAEFDWSRGKPPKP